MDIQTLNPVLIRKLGLKALAKNLGPIGMVRFLQQFEGGVGDYTTEREQWLKDIAARSVIKEIKEARRKKQRVK
jgi:hypothetical protein